jgi:prepilin-type N-terminal cleavage/methylation domain-containing protein
MKFRKGFTLVEILIAIVVMTIAFFAVLAVQGTAIGSYNAARDSTEASEVARATTEYLQMESSQWNTGNLGTVLAAYTGTKTPFDVAPVLPALAASDLATWVPLVDTPVDVRLARGAGFTGTKFCLFARGAYVEADTTDLNAYDTAGDLTGSPIFRVQLGVVYSGARATLPVNGAGEASCTLIDTTQLLPEDPSILELQGLRSAYFGTVVVRRDFLR